MISSDQIAEGRRLLAEVTEVHEPTSTTLMDQRKAQVAAVLTALIDAAEKLARVEEWAKQEDYDGDFRAAIIQVRTILRAGLVGEAIPDSGEPDESGGV